MCPLTTDGSLQLLHEAEDNAHNWLETTVIKALQNEQRKALGVCEHLVARVVMQQCLSKEESSQWPLNNAPNNAISTALLEDSTTDWNIHF